MYKKERRTTTRLKLPPSRVERNCVIIIPHKIKICTVERGQQQQNYIEKIHAARLILNKKKTRTKGNKINGEPTAVPAFKSKTPQG